MKNKRIYLSLILCFSFIFFIAPSNFVYAEDSSSLNIILTYEQKAISGAEFSIYQVADLKEDKSGYTIKDPFQWSGSFTDIKTADAQLKLSLNFEKQSRNVKELMKLKTGGDGVVNFTGLEDGMYLVVETGVTEEAEDYTHLQPFLVMVPQFENGTWNKTVNAKPKTEIQRKEKPKIPPQVPPSDIPQKPHSELPKTGDVTNVFWWNGLLLISGVLLLLLWINKKDKMGEES